MLNITPQMSSEGSKAYFSQSDYLSEVPELVGQWSGLLSEQLGLGKVVDKLAFDRLCENLHPQTGEQLTASTREGRRVGYDFMRCFTVTITGLRLESLFYLLQDDRMRVVRQVKNDFDDQSNEPLVRSISSLKRNRTWGSNSPNLLRSSESWKLSKILQG